SGTSGRIGSGCEPSMTSDPRERRDSHRATWRRFARSTAGESSARRTSHPRAPHLVRASHLAPVLFAMMALHETYLDAGCHRASLRIGAVMQEGAAPPGSACSENGGRAWPRAR